MTTQTFNATISPYRSAGWTAIASGTIGILAYVALTMAVTTRTTMALARNVYILFTTHDVGMIIQLLLMIPVVFAVHKLSHQRDPGMSPATLATAVVAISLTVFILLVALPKIMLADFYFFPLGMFGVWIILASWRTKGLLSGGLRWFGMFVGLGLALTGLYPIGYFIFVTPRILQIPAPDPATMPDSSLSLANTILHVLIWVGSLMGVLTLPFWTILLGFRLFREANVQPNAKTIINQQEILSK